MVSNILAAENVALYIVEGDSLISKVPSPHTVKLPSATVMGKCFDQREVVVQTISNAKGGKKIAVPVKAAAEDTTATLLAILLIETTPPPTVAIASPPSSPNKQQVSERSAR